MKLLKIGISLLAALSLIACSSDDDSSSAPAYALTAENIVGVYETSSYGLEKESSGEVGGQAITIVDTEEAIELENSELVLLADKTFSLSGFNRIKFTSNGVVTNESMTVNFEDEGTYELDVDNEKITFTSTDTFILVGEYTIEKITASELTITQTEFDNSSATETVSTVITYSFNR